MSETETAEYVKRTSRERLYPPIHNPSWLILRKRRQLFQQWLQNIPAGNLRVLDIGGRIQPYRPLLGEACASYVAVDLRGTAVVDVIARAEQLPFLGQQFDLVLCTQVLQYVADPALAIAETYRVLKPGGFFLLSVPSIYPRDAQEECWRFLPAGIRHLLMRFSQVEIVSEGGSITGFFRTMNVSLHLFARYAPAKAMYDYTLCPLLNLLGALLEWLLSRKDVGLAANYSVLARK